MPELDPISQIDWTLVTLKLWLEEALQHLESRGTSDKCGHPHGYSISPIPDWQIRQKLECIDAAREAIRPLVEEKEPNVEA